MSFANIKSALVSAYVNRGFSLPTAYENKQFDPKPGKPWASLVIVPNQPSASSVGEFGEDQHDGFFQIDLNYPLNTGDGAILAKADEISWHFRAGRAFVYADQTVRIRSAGRSPGRVVDGFYRISLTINWTARVARS